MSLEGRGGEGGVGHAGRCASVSMLNTVAASMSARRAAASPPSRPSAYAGNFGSENSADVPDRNWKNDCIMEDDLGRKRRTFCEYLHLPAVASQHNTGQAGSCSTTKLGCRGTVTREGRAEGGARAPTCPGPSAGARSRIRGSAPCRSRTR